MCNRQPLKEEHAKDKTTQVDRAVELTCIKTSVFPLAEKADRFVFQALDIVYSHLFGFLCVECPLPHSATWQMSLPLSRSSFVGSSCLPQLLLSIVVQSLSCVPLFVTPWTASHQASLSFIISQSLLKLLPIESVMPSNHLILSHHLLFLPSVFPSISVFSNELAPHISW